MGKSVKKYQPSLRLLSLLLLLILIGGYLYQEKYLSCLTSDLSLCIKSKKYVSANLKFSFRYSPDYPLTFKTGQDLADQYHFGNRYVEWVNFSREFYPNAGGDKRGSVIVEKNSTYGSVKEIGDKTLSDFNVLPERLKGTPPKIEYLRVGGENAVRITTSQQPSSFEPPSDEYVLIHEGKLYRMSFDYNDYYHKQPLEDYKKGKELILNTFSFGE